MKIKIQPKAETKITAALEQVNHRASAHTATADDIITACTEAEKQLDALNIPKKDRAGAEYVLLSGGTVAKSYKYQRTVNVVTATRGTTGWYLTGITKKDVWPNQGPSFRLGVTQSQQQIAINNLSTKFYICK